MKLRRFSWLILLLVVAMVVAACGGDDDDDNGDDGGDDGDSVRLSQSFTVESDVNGNFWFDDVEPGEDYQLQIRPGSGYKNKDINPLVIPAGGLHLDIVLELGDTGELSGWMIWRKHSM